MAGGATAAGAATGGMGALPAAGVVALAILADTAAVSVGSIQGAAYVGAHYGYDPTQPSERAMMLSVLAGTVAADTAKMQTLLQVRKLALDLAARRTIEQLSHDVDTVADEDLTGAPDGDVLRAATTANRVVITLDRGFGDIRAYPPGSHGGVLILRSADQSPAAVTRDLEQLLRSRPGEACRLHRRVPGRRAAHPAATPVRPSRKWPIPIWMGHSRPNDVGRLHRIPGWARSHVTLPHLMNRRRRPRSRGERVVAGPAE